MTTEVRQKRNKQEIRGIVTSDKMNKTRTIQIERTLRHSLYHKNVMRSSKIYIHDEKNESKVGDVVTAVSTRPLSRHKQFRLLKIVEKRVQQ
ncbi:MAG: 30S ribosomal protein S17 [Proteobacteria bacterium]|nr:30S ribosomal protein S17 [Pseudomonadota bacterium]NDC24293.1 30S ribosomal protein S17 [Pseudomonadota bacterium]NDD04753.1 30S ribosomal protein S17 [Pseudomonadota bacterium]NDG26354.1 30S ribosomal protein S17 [Pseudomonadota bacterium]